MTAASSFDEQLVYLTVVAEEGVAAGTLEAALNASKSQVRSALGRAVQAKQIRDGRAGYVPRAGVEAPELSSREERALLSEMRRAVASAGGGAIALARLLQSADSSLDAASLDAIAGAVERGTPSTEARALVDDVLRDGRVRLHPAQYARLALGHLNMLDASDPPRVWRDGFERCYRTAVEAENLVPALDILERRVGQLLADGNQREAEIEVHLAHDLLDDVPSAKLAVEIMLSRVLIHGGERVEAQELLEQTVLEGRAARLPDVQRAQEALNRVLVLQLDPGAREALAVQRKRSSDRDAASNAMAASAGAGLAFMDGDVDEARRLIGEAIAHPTNKGQGFYEPEQNAIEAAEAFARAEFDRAQSEVEKGLRRARSSGNTYAERSLLSLRMRHQILLIDRPGVTETWGEIQTLADRLSPPRAIAITGLGSAADMVIASRPRLIAGLREATTYTGFGGVLAAMEVLAVAGSRSSALSLRVWGEAALKRGVITAPDWPAHLDRVLALVNLRLGKQQRQVERLMRAAERADEMGHVVEAAIARLQYAETNEALGARTVSQSPTEARERGVEALLTWGIQPEPLALRAAQSVLRGNASRVTADLSKGQADVIQLLSEGLTYKQVGVRLGISWRTVQTQAKYAYAKLGAHDRADAIARARKRGEI
jgi:DNA-binding NarL/FixJ family response regulator